MVAGQSQVVRAMGVAVRWACLAVVAVVAVVAVGVLAGAGARAGASGRRPLDERLVEFNDWFEDVSRERPRVAAAASGTGAGNTVVGLGPGVSVGDVVVDLELRWVVCASTVRGSRIGAQIEPLLQDAHAVVGLAVYLLYERDLGVRSRFYPWIEVLPRRVDAPHVWSRAQRALLGRDPVVGKIAAHKAKIKAEYVDRVVPWLRAHKPDWLGRKAFSMQRYVWARFMIDSRAWVLRGVRYLVPMADMFNFAPSETQLASGARSRTPGEVFTRTHLLRGSRVVVLAETEAGPGAELTESYGDNPNEIYLVYHGFVPAVNPDECVDVPLGLAAKQAKISTVAPLIKGLGLRKRGSVCVHGSDSPLDAVPAWALQLMALLELSSSEAAALVAAHKTRPVETLERVRAFARRAVAPSLVAAFKSALDRSSVGSARAALAAAGHDPVAAHRAQMVVLFLETRARILREAVEWGEAVGFDAGGLSDGNAAGEEAGKEAGDDGGKIRARKNRKKRKKRKKRTQVSG